MATQSKQFSINFTLLTKLLGIAVLVEIIIILSLYYLEVKKFVTYNLFHYVVIISLIAYFISLIATTIYIKSLQRGNKIQ